MIGTWAVYLFFLLSGYWIARLWESKYKHCGNPYLVFMVSRFWRLLPVYYACTAVMALCDWKITHHLYTWNKYFHSPSWQISNFFILGAARMPSIIAPVWSLDIEMQFYVLAPLLLWLLLKCLGGPRRAARVAILCCLCVFAFMSMPLMICVVPYLLFFIIGFTIANTRWQSSPRLALGSALAVLVLILAVPAFSRWEYAVGNGAFRIPYLKESLFGEPYEFHSVSGPNIFDRAFTLLVVASAIPGIAFCLRRKSSPIDRALGDMAYPIYLFHYVPLLMVGRFRHLDAIPHPLAIIALTFAGSSPIYLLIDRPIERYRKQFVESQDGRNKTQARYFARIAGVEPSTM